MQRIEDNIWPQSQGKSYAEHPAWKRRASWGEAFAIGLIVLAVVLNCVVSMWKPV